jgi:hypothetical protein
VTEVDAQGNLRRFTDVYMPAPGPLKLPDLSGLTVLVVDDNDDAVEVLTTFLKACGADVLFARSAPS